MHRLDQRIVYCLAGCLVCLACNRAVVGGVNYEEAPINYSSTPPNNVVSQLQARLNAGEAALKYESGTGYLRSILELLDVPTSSQVLVFSKTSLQDDKISPQTPRAIYFNDTLHIGFVQQGMIEIAVTDPGLGMAFYTLPYQESARPTFHQEANSCLNCHGAARTKSVPGVLIRSVFTDPQGEPVIAAGSYLTTLSSPFEQRWGGWYVTGTHGDMKHLGNMTLPDSKKPKTIDNTKGMNVTDLSSKLETGNYLTPHSDPVALMVLEHQTEVFNWMTKASFETRHALYIRDQTIAENPGSAQEADMAAQLAIKKAANPLVDSLLFHKEVPLPAPIQGTSQFAMDFASRGFHDPQGRSLHDLDLKTRLFQHACSYLIESPSFRTLPTELRTEVIVGIRHRLAHDPVTLELVDALLAANQSQ